MLDTIVSLAFRKSYVISENVMAWDDPRLLGCTAVAGQRNQGVLDKLKRETTDGGEYQKATVVPWGNTWTKKKKNPSPRPPNTTSPAAL
jgi:hypothetical protein